ncbi:hypothetical protein ABZ342_11450 [Amycolatopsis sp. NPDC005961]|uniref:hypothetical protein n=1 Tax=Amycolatopsis sp. NPDC005961 TaxID=3156720 RepID=UPI00340D7B9D
MPVPLKVRGLRPPASATPAADLRRPEQAGAADMVRARTMLGNAVVTAAMTGLPPGATPDPASWTGRMLLAGQNSVGNQAVANRSATNRAGAPATPAPGPLPTVTAARKPPVTKVPPASPAGPKAAAPVPPGNDQKDQAAPDKPTADKAGKQEKGTGPRSPGADPKFQALEKDVTAKKKAIGSSHPPAAAEAGSAHAAAEPPADDREARGKAAHAEDMDAAKPKAFDKQEFVAAVKKAVADKAPKNLDEADKFSDSGKAEEVKNEVQGKVGEGKDASAKEIADTTAAPPEPAPDGKQVVPMAPDKVPGKPGTPDPNLATPDRLPPSATDMSAGPDQVGQDMTKAKVTEEQLGFDNAHEPAFDKAVKDKKTMDAHSEAAPKKLRAEESGELKQVKVAAATQGAAAMTGIHTTRLTTGTTVRTRKGSTKKSDEDKQKEVTDLLQKLFDQTKSDVEKILADLDEKVDNEFTAKEKVARDRFTEEHEDGMRRYKDERYGGWWGWTKWVKDKFAGLPEEANRIYEHARDNYLVAMDGIITGIADTVDGELKRAKDRIASGRKEIKAAVEKLPADLKAIGRQAAADLDARFDELTDTVDEKGSDLVDHLATRYTDAVKSVDDEIAAEKEKNKGLVAKAIAAIGGAIKTIIELGRLLLGVLAKAASAVGYILENPIGFLGNLVTGVGGGLKLFMKNAGRHLEQGVLAWLLGTGIGASAGLMLPATFDILGILMMIATLLGLSWPNIRSRLARKVPDKAITAAETSIPLVSNVKRRGVAGMWDDLKTRVGDLKKDLIGKLVSYLMPTIVIAGITWIASLFTPASAFIRACKMIIDIIRFVVTNARRIIEFVNAVLDAVIAIAKGGTGGVPALVENALARAIPVLIGALAALLGLGGIAGKVKNIFQQIARPVNRAVDWVIDKISGLVKKLWARLKPKPGKKRRPGRPKRPRRPARDRPRRRRRDDRHRPGKRRPDRRDKRADKKKHSLAAALREATRLLKDQDATPESIRRKLPAIKRKYKLTSIQLKKIGKDSYAIRLAINPQAETPPEELFPYEVGKAKGAFTISRREGVVEQLSPHRIPMEGLDKRMGFVVTIATIPSGVENNPDLAVRYLTAGWESGTKDLAAARTAVVIGVNGLEHLDPSKGKEEITGAVKAVRKTPELLLAVFGFVWTPRWVKRGTDNAVPFTEVRAAYRDLQDPKVRKHAEDQERGLRDKKALPYGLFRQEVLGSSYVGTAVGVLKDLNDVVYVVGQDADTGATAKNTMGVLAAYKKVLEEMSEDPLLVVGGYHFAGYQWKGHGTKRREQLTVQFNEIDRAVRVAINEKYPQMLYPTEPNMLIKAFENRQGRLRGIFQNTRAKALLAAQGEIYGVGGAEGRFLRNRLMEVFGVEFKIVFVPEVSTMTSPEPGDVGRGLESTAAHVRAAARGKRLTVEDGKVVESGVIRRAHRAYAMILQSQTMVSAVNLARELTMATPGLNEIRPRRARDRFKADLQDRVFVHVEEVALLMADTPKLTGDSPEIKAQLDELRDDVATLVSQLPAQGREEAQQAVAKAGELAERIIDAMTADELKSVWRPLSTLLKTIDRERRSRERRA